MSKKINRREFLKTAGAVSLGTVVGLKPGSSATVESVPQPKGKSVAGMRAPKLDRVRTGFIGVGARGSGHVEQMLLLDGVEVMAICDNHAPTAEASGAAVRKVGKPAPELYTKGDHDYRRMLERDDIDIVVISTPWEWHAPMAVDAMKAGKHVFLEVPAALTTEECWQLVDTSEQTQRHCMMMENVCYGREELMVLNMCRQGLFGELLHGEAAYIHDLRGQMHEEERGTGSWRTHHYKKRNGNLYPTHGLGPICQYMNINRGDKLEYLSSVSSPSRAREIYAKKHFPETHKWRKGGFVCGDINTTIVKTALGRSIMIQWDEQLPRPYNRLNLIQGTQGIWGGFPNRIVREADERDEHMSSANTHSWVQGGGLEPWFARYDHPLHQAVAKDPANKGGHGGMDFIMLWRIVYCLRNGLPVDQDVYDAAAWSVITPLSEWSVAHKSQSVDIPDFTRGKWKTAAPLSLDN